MTDKIIIFDTTLRDGEQSPGYSMNTAEKMYLASQLEKLRVDVLEAGFPSSSEGDFEAVQMIAKKIRSVEIAALARTFKEDITAAWSAIKEAANPRIRQSISQATIKISVGEEEELTAAEGNGPVNAIDNALRKALIKFYPRIQEMRLVDFKVRVLEGSAGTAARVRVLIESRDGKDIWNTVGVSENIIEASWQALVDSIYFKLSKD